MARRLFAMVVCLAIGLVWPGPVEAGATGSFDRERVWNAGFDDWEPTVAADPGSSYVYQMTTRYGGPSACQPGRQHCIIFRASPDGGTSWHADQLMCPACRNVTGQNDPELKVAADGTIYAAWMNDFNVVLARSSDHGRTWTRPVDLRRGSGLSFTDKPILVISTTGRDVYIAFNASDSYVVASHDHGRTFSKPVKTNHDGLYWFAEGGAVAPDGTVYFSESAENQDETGPVQLWVLKSTNGGASWTATLADTSRQQPTCHAAECPGDFYGSQASIAVDRAGTVVLAYSANTSPRAPLHMLVRRWKDGAGWSERHDLTGGRGTVGAGFPSIVAGGTSGDFRLAFQEDRNGPTSWNTWFLRTADSGRTWTDAVRLSNRGSGAPYKHRAGYVFPYGDYFGMAVDGAGTTFAIWGEGPGYVGPGGVWYTRGS